MKDQERMKEILKDYLQGLSDDNKISIHNETMQEINYYDDEIHYNDDDFFNTYFENKPLEAVRSAKYGDYNYVDEYVRFNGYGNLESFNTYNLDDYILYDEIVDHMVDEEDYSILESYGVLDDFIELLEDEELTLYDEE
jgi:hypothetical protein